MSNREAIGTVLLLLGLLSCAVYAWVTHPGKPVRHAPAALPLCSCPRAR